MAIPPWAWFARSFFLLKGIFSLPPSPIVCSQGGRLNVGVFLLILSGLFLTIKCLEATVVAVLRKYNWREQNLIHLQSGVAFEGRKALEVLARTVTRASANHHTVRYVDVLHRLGVLIVHIHQLVHDLTRALCHHLRQLNYYIRGWILIFKSFAAGRRAFSVGHDKEHHSYLYWDPLHLTSANNKNH